MPDPPGARDSTPTETHSGVSPFAFGWVKAARTAADSTSEMAV